MYLSTNNVSICWDTLHEYTDTVHNTTDENSSTGLLPDLNVLNEHVSKDVWKKNLLQQNPSVLTCECRLAHTDIIVAT